MPVNSSAPALVLTVMEFLIPELMHLQLIDPKQPLYIYINSPETNCGDNETDRGECEVFAIFDALIETFGESLFLFPIDALLPRFSKPASRSAMEKWRKSLARSPTPNPHDDRSPRKEPPSNIFFYCSEPSPEGGETSIVASDVVVEKMEERLPEVMDKVADVGLVHIQCGHGVGKLPNHVNPFVLSLLCLAFFRGAGPGKLADHDVNSLFVLSLLCLAFFPKAMGVGDHVESLCACSSLLDVFFFFDLRS
ncbi:hypothetical protein KSP40_PGU007225 [Platanthera guangdongensis]|uniref:TauD/TfdA-like domain-containing protein n=1 Tax=Platanthera guangdongensis TaxID=2320717 RepID=A0ABR2MT95_9ASPA